MFKRIESPKNPTLKALATLKERRARDKEQRYLIEGMREVSRALQAGEDIEMLLMVPELLKAEGPALAEHQDVDILELSKEAFSKLSLRQNPDGMMAVAKMKPKPLASLQLSDHALVLIIEGLEKPGNIGALLRTADAVNVEAVFITGGGTDLYNPNVIRASMGSIFTRPVLAVETNELLTYLQDRMFNIVAATPHAQHLYWHEDLSRATAIVLGTEHEGLSQAWLEAATTQVKIPMYGLADSLNVATAGALLMYEALRQRVMSS